MENGKIVVRLSVDNWYEIMVGSKNNFIDNGVSISVMNVYVLKNSLIYGNS